jgi:integrase
VSRKRRGRGESALFSRTRRWKAKDAAGNVVVRERVQWVAVVSEGVDSETNKRRRVYLYGSSKQAVQEKLFEHLTKAGGARRTTRPTKATTFAAVAGMFLEDARKNLSANTARSYEQTLAHVLPTIGPLRLDRLDGPRIERLYADLRNELSASLTARVHVVLRCVLNAAKKKGLIRSSPLETVKAPRYKRPVVQSLTLAELKRLLVAAEGDRLHALFVVAATTGVRQGELFALTWDDLDLDRRTLSVSRSAQEIDGQVTIVEPKSESSLRLVELPQVAVKALRERRKLAKAEGHKSKLVFPSPSGTTLRKSNFLRRVFYPIREAAGLRPTLTFHHLRHTAASLMLLQGASPKLVQEVLGHADVTLTLRTYSHVLPGVSRQAADSMDALLAPPASRGRGQIVGTRSVQRSKSGK